MPRSNQPPKYRHHKRSGQAVVTLQGRDIYLGPFGSAASRDLYARLLAGVVSPDSIGRGKSRVRAVEPEVISVVELLAAFWDHAKTYYLNAEGRPNGDHNNFRTLIQRLKDFAGKLSVSDFGPKRLREFRQEMIDDNLARTTINNRVNLIRRIFQWGVGHELVPPMVLEALRAVEPLRFGKTNARETEPVKPVAWEWVEATLEYCPPHLAAMIRLQALTGMRSGELVQMRTCDVTTEGEVWEYRPFSHKTKYRGHERIIFLGPQAQEVLKPWLRRDPNEHLFQPREMAIWRRTQARRAAKRPNLKSQSMSRPNDNACYFRAPGPRFSPGTYKHSIDAAIRKCNRQRTKAGESPIRWHPHQLRHLAATILRREFGLETARVVLGHKSAAITETYAEVDLQRAAEAMARKG